MEYLTEKGNQTHYSDLVDKDHFGNIFLNSSGKFQKEKHQKLGKKGLFVEDFYSNSELNKDSLSTDWEKEIFSSKTQDNLNQRYLEITNFKERYNQLICRMQFLCWIAKDSAPKPLFIEENEEKRKIKLNEIKILAKESKETRRQFLKTVCLGEDGLFDKKYQILFEKLIDELIGSYYSKDENISENENNLKETLFVGIKALLKSEDEVKKLRILENIFDLLNDKNLDYTKLTTNILSISGPVGVKLAQILASQPELKTSFPKFISGLEELKENNSGGSLYDLMESLATIPQLANKDIKIIKQLAAASIKTVLLVEIDGQIAVLKITRINANKNTETAKQDYLNISEAVKPFLAKHWNINHLPNYADRIFADIDEETELNIEKDNYQKTKKLCQNYNNSNLDSNFIFKTPFINNKFSNSILMVEQFVSNGVSLSKLKKESKLTPDLENQINQQISKFFIKSLNVKYHGDLHDGNIFVDLGDLNNPNNKIQIYFIDLGLADTIPSSRQDLANLVRQPELDNILKSINFDDINKILEILANLKTTNNLLKIADFILNNFRDNDFSVLLKVLFRLEIKDLKDKTKYLDIAKILIEQEFEKLKNPKLLSQHNLPQTAYNLLNLEKYLETILIDFKTEKDKKP